MEAEKWQKAKEIFNTAIKCEPLERASFLDQACGTDENLRREVESLLFSYNDADSFLEKPPIDGEDFNETKQLQISNGASFGHYEIIKQIGAGGMGEVYLAQDKKLDRKVAIKILNEQFSNDTDKLSRFVREAKAVSALNHPNILTVYEIGEADETKYIATEFIDGRTLREHLSAKDKMSSGQILKIGIQVAEALSAAHQAGIIHRDIKPENIMIRQDGYAKVLDFGLAKLTEKKKLEQISLEGNTKVLVQTNPGIIMGTVSYMSPEQARGKEVDARTDIWSFGVVLYEMLAGKLPFMGETINHTIVSILEKEPILLENVPDELNRIVRKTLTKELGMRYQTARDLLIDLKNLNRDLDIRGELERSVTPNKFNETNAGDKNATQIDTAGKNFSLEYAIAQAGKNKLATAIIGIILFGIISAIIYFGFFATRSGKQIESIAVLPFVNEGGNQDAEYLSDGMTETLISSLSNLPNMNVKPRSTVFRYKGKASDANAVGKELNVQAVLNGRIVQREQDISLFVELIDIALDKVVWSQQYNRKQTDLITLKNEIARDVADKLKAKLSGADAQKLTKNSTENPEAYQYYLQGRYFLNKQTNKDVEKSLEYFQKAIALDPNYALAYAGLADALSLNVVGSNRERLSRAYEAALKAVALDNDLAEAHTALGRIILAYNYDFAGAEREMRRGIELNLNIANAHHFLGDLLSIVGRHEEAEVEFRRALELEPLSLHIQTTYARALVVARRYDDAISQLKKTLEIEPNYVPAYFGLSVVYQITGKYAESVEARARWLELNSDGETAALTRESFAKGGWEGFLKYITGERRPKTLVNYLLGVYHLELGEKDEAFAALEKSYENREVPLLQNLKNDPRLDPLREDMRYRELLKKVGFPP